MYSRHWLQPKIRKSCVFGQRDEVIDSIQKVKGGCISMYERCILFMCGVGVRVSKWGGCGECVLQEGVGLRRGRGIGKGRGSLSLVRG